MASLVRAHRGLPLLLLLSAFTTFTAAAAPATGAGGGTGLSGAGLGSTGLDGTGTAVALTQVSSDPFTTSTAQHATEVEPDTFASGDTVVGAFQVGRFVDGGATDIGFARSADGGSSWRSGMLPGLTSSSGAADSPYQRISDPSVAYDAAHRVWLVSSLPITPAGTVPTVLVSRSGTDGRTWSAPVSIPPPDARTVDLDKNWTACDNSPTSPFRGHCYTTFDNYGAGDVVLTSTSTDGGLSWSTPIPTAGRDKGLGGQPVVRPDGVVVVPFLALNGRIAAFGSADGGASWTRATDVAAVRSHTPAGLRTAPLPSAEPDADGRVYVAWQDCRFRVHCSANDIVLASSADGLTWSEPVRVPIDDLAGGADHVIPGLAVDPRTAGGSAHLGLVFHVLPDAACTTGCRLDIGYVSSPDGGAHWGPVTALAGPIRLDDLAATTQGAMVGDYVSASFSGGRVTTLFAVGLPRPSPTGFDEAMNAPAVPLPVATADEATAVASPTGAAPLTGVGTGTTIQLLRRD